MKKLAQSVLMAVCMMLVFLPITVLAAEQPTSGTCGDGVTWTYEPKYDDRGRDEGGTLTISGSGAMTDYNTATEVPWYNILFISTIKIENGVTHIGDRVFFSRHYLTNVDIADSVVSIGDYAFEHCSSLSNLFIPNSVASIGRSAFSQCSGLNNIYLSEGVTNIGDSAFWYCENLSEIELPDSLRTIGSEAFGYTALTTISIPDGVIRLDGAFDSCHRLTEISVAANNSQYSSIDGILLSKEGAKLLLCPNGKASCTIPATVTTIEDNAFSHCKKLSHIEIPDGVISIGYNTFYDCVNLTSIVISNSVTEIGWYAFRGCTNLNNIAIPEGISSLNGSFDGCLSLATVSLPASIAAIGSNTFANCVQLKTVNYAGSETQWGTVRIAEGNQELGQATLICAGSGTTIDPDAPNTPTVPTQPGTLQLTTANGGLGKKVSVTVTGGHWLTIQVRRAGSVAISSLQAPGSGSVSVTFSAASGSTVQVWETAEEMSFANGIPENQILNTATRDL